MQYDIVDNGDTLASGDCKPNHASATNVYVCRYTVAASVNGAFTVKAGAASVDKAGNALASVYTHAATLTLDTTQPDTSGTTQPYTLGTTTIWSATLTVDPDTNNTNFGCDNGYSDIDDCSTALTEDDIRLGASTYEVSSVIYDSSSPGSLELQIKDLIGTEVHNAFGSLTLYVNGVGYRVSDSATTILAIRWPFDPSRDWADGATVSLALAAREDPAAVNHVVTGPVCETPTLTGVRCWVPHDSPLIPSAADLSPGQSFRLMFVTSDGKAATDTTVGPYNAHVQTAASSTADFRPLKAYFRAMVQPSTMADYMKPNTRTRSGDLGEDDPIYWVKGAKVADSYADLYDGSWDYTNVSGDNPTDEAGTAVTGAWKVWTGSKPDGTPLTAYQMGSDNVMYGLIQTSGRELGAASAVTSGASKNVNAKATEQALYGISPMLTVGFDPKAPRAAHRVEGAGVGPGSAAVVGRAVQRRAR